eukprot:TRINITY_DN42105_c0_g2_i1.p1 TRINITY_DN42105_c0_g2~~TRINITY_DN42105_c0_g2_i1.p1  ORF type:complete len:510 (+),score=127.14 TRINITY_DN42105_c0_g2_i1:63-1592(+)
MARFVWLLFATLCSVSVDSIADDVSPCPAGDCSGRSAGSSLRQLLGATGCGDAMCLFGKAFVAEEDHALHGRHNVDTSEIYGEVALSGMEKLMDLFEWGPNTSFYDLGCGAGRLVIFAALTRELRRARGIEKVSERLELAGKALAKLESLASGAGAVEWLARPEFDDADFSDVDISDATAIYMASVYFPDELMNMLANRFLELREGARIASLVKFPFDRHGKRKLPADSPLQALRIINKVDIPMSWSQDEGMSVFVYEVNRRAAQKEQKQALPASATIAEILPVLKEVVEPADDAVWAMDVSALTQRLSSLQVSATDELALLRGRGSASMLALRTVLAVLSTPAQRVAAVTDDPAARAVVEDAIAALKQFAPGHVAWHRRISVEADVPPGVAVVEAGGDAGSFARLRALGAGLVVAGYAGCLPGWSPAGGDTVALAPAPVEAHEAALKSLDELGDKPLEWLQLKPYMADRTRWVRFASLAGSSALRIPASIVAAWLRAAKRCDSSHQEL